MKKIMKVFLLFVAAATIISGCRKDETKDDGSSASNNAAEVNATISGIVTDDHDQAITGAQVTTGALSVTTDHYGFFLLRGNVTKDRCVLTIVKSGFLKRLYGMIPKINTINYVRIGLAGVPNAQTVSSSNGGSVTMNSGGSIQFAGNSFVLAGSSTPYNGTVYVTTIHYATSDLSFSYLIPGGDLAGKNSAGDDVSLYSFGMTSATLKGSSGEDLQLATGSPATITFPIATNQLGSAPATISLWYLDETTALWKEEGTATKVGNNYVGTVAHFSAWNCDYGGPRAYVNGRVVDCEGIPLANVIVTINGGVTVITDGSGSYTLWVPSGWALTFQVLPQGIIAVSSQMENVAALSAGQTYTVPDLVVPCGARLIGHLTNCSNESIDGTALILQNDLVATWQQTTSGTFRLTAAENTAYRLTAFSSSGIYSEEVTTPSANDSLVVGTMQLCNEITSVTSFNLTGNGFNNSTISFLTIDQNDAAWNSSYYLTEAFIGGYTTMGLCSLSMNFAGNQPVTIDFSSLLDSTTNFSFSLGSESYVASNQSDNPFILEITHYGPVGDSIKGNFHGGARVNWSADVVTITDGKFAFPRVADH